MNPYTKLPKATLLYGRHDFLLNIARGKRVLHLGCVDAGLLQERFARGQLMHQRLAQIAEELWGFDIDQAGIDFLRGQGFENLIAGDVSYVDQYEQLRNIEFDIILASEVVEHLQNPGLFFAAVRRLMVPEHTKLVVSVPNAFRIDTLLWLLRGIEYVHPDHNYWFSYVTITNLFKKNNFDIEQVHAYSFQQFNILPQAVGKYFKHREMPAVTTTSVTSGDSEDAQSSSSTSFYRKALNYLKALPKRLLVSSLYSKTSFWGDGLIIVATLKERNVE